MKAADGVHVEWVEGEAVVLDPQTGELHYLNESSALLFALIQEKGSQAAVAEIKSRFPGEPDIGSQLDRAIADMVEKGLLVNE